MTDSMAALSALINYGQGDYPQQALAAFTTSGGTTRW